MVLDLIALILSVVGLVLAMFSWYVKQSAEPESRIYQWQYRRLMKWLEKRDRERRE